MPLDRGSRPGHHEITQAKIKNAIADFSGISAAYHGYQDRYRAIPGDDSGAVARWGTPASTGTAGNGVVEGAYGSEVANTESRLWWEHLRRAGFVAGTGQNQPFNAVVGKLGVQTGDTAGASVLASAGPPAIPGMSGLIVCSANLPDKIAIAIDTQMDDGAPTSGGVRAQLQTAPNPAVAAASVANYAETGSNIYLLCRSF